LTKIALVLIFAGLGFRITAVPFHFYAPDVYQGSSHTNAALLSVIPKAAGMVVLVRLAVVAMPGTEPFGWRVAMALSLVTMTLGNVVALWQGNLRRLLAYSSIAHAGYLLIGLSVALSGSNPIPGWDGVGALLFYLCAYALATIGAFAALVYLGRRDRQVDTVAELAGLARTRPLLATVLAVFMFSLAGIPPLAGFWGKLLIFGSALMVDAGPTSGEGRRTWFIALAIAGVVNSAIAAAYYLRVVATMYFRAPLGTLRAEGGRGSWVVAMACAILVVALGLYGRPLVQWSMAASPTSKIDEASDRPADGPRRMGWNYQNGSIAK
jgi:NADH-quinone oxidoreductase subunit N